MYISLWENSRGHPDNISFMQFSTKIDGFEQKDSQDFNSYNSYEQYPLEKFLIFTIYQNYTLALRSNTQAHLQFPTGPVPALLPVMVIMLLLLLLLLLQSSGKAPTHNIRNITSLESFKSHLKHFLFNYLDIGN